MEKATSSQPCLIQRVTIEKIGFIIGDTANHGDLHPPACIDLGLPSLPKEMQAFEPADPWPTGNDFPIVIAKPLRAEYNKPYPLEIG